MADFKLDTFQPQNFKIDFERIPATTYLTQQFTIPGIQGGAATQATPFNTVPLPGDAVQYDYMQLTFNLDEDWKNYAEIQKWINQINFPQSFEQYQSLEAEELPTMSNASVVMMNNANRPIRELRFIDCFPINLSQIPLNVAVPNAQPVPVSTVFAYSYFELV